MVTIEQKLLLFSKLLNQSMDKKYNEDLKKLDTEYESLLNKNKEATDSEALEIEEKAKKQAEMLKTEQISKTKVLVKKEIMNVKEHYFKIFMDNLKNKLIDFTETENYKSYLEKIISKLNLELIKLNKYYTDLKIYLNLDDYNKYNEFIKQEIDKEIKNKNITFKILNDVMGGIIAEIPEHNIRFNLTLDAVLEESESYIMQTLFEALEAGE